MSDDAGILRAAEADLSHARRLLTDHVRACKNLGCGDCESLAAHAGRTQLQLELLMGADPQMEELF